MGDVGGGARTETVEAMLMDLNLMPDRMPLEPVAQALQLRLAFCIRGHGSGTTSQSAPAAVSSSHAIAQTSCYSTRE